MNTPLLSVCLITYNHERYIGQAIEGVLMQQVNFDIELIIADDCSTDLTREIIEKYKKENPDLIKLILQKKNVGPAKNWMELITTPTSKYIAYFEGDDYWTDPLKLQKQVDFLEKTMDAVACFHNSVCVDENNTIINEQYFRLIDKESFNQNEVLKELLCSYSTSALVFRKDAINNNIHELEKNPCDFILDIIMSEYGKLYYLHENMSVYRIHSGGVWQGQSYFYNKNVMLERYLFLFKTKRFKKRYNSYLWKIIIDLYVELINIADTKSQKNILKLKQLLFLNFFEKRTYKLLKYKIKMSLHYRLKKIKR